ncbi:flagellin, partial [Campylobacter pinnipediorum]|uniref:flagellin n=1 Tax=Campylobacter pinnipediorum TaxID=1965231 RepID=UPI00214CB0DF
IDPQGKLVLTSRDGRAIKISGGANGDKAIGKRLGVSDKISLSQNMFIGRLNLVRLDGRDIKISSGGDSAGKFSVAFSAGNNGDAGGNQKSVSLREIKGQIASDTAAAMGFQRMTKSTMTSAQAAGVMTLRGAMAVMDIAESAQRTLDFIRSDLGSVQNQLVATVNNITVTQVNVKSAESQIRDVDFAAESANFSKYNILAQSGSYAMSQANSVQQNVLKLLQ